MAVPTVSLVGLIVAGVGLLLQFISMGTTEWVVYSDNDEIHSGIFQACANDDCEDIDDPSSDLESVRAMVIIGMLAGIAGVALALIYVIMQVCGKTPMRIFAILSTLACIAATVFDIIGVIIYASKIYDDLKDNFDLGFSFALCIVAAVLFVVGGVITILGSRSSD